MAATNGAPVIGATTGPGAADYGWSADIVNVARVAPTDVYNSSDNGGLVAAGVAGAVAGTSTRGIVAMNTTARLTQHEGGRASGQGPTGGDGVGFDWFERVHFQPLRVDAGLVTGVQQHLLRVHNAYREATADLDSMVNNVSADVDVIDLPTLPYAMAALTTYTYTLEIQPEGVPDLDGDLVWTFASGQIFLVRVVGSRVVHLPWIPLDGQDETLAWVTDVLGAYGREQRRGLRSVPRRTINMRFLVRGTDRARLEDLLSRQTQAFVVPLAWDQRFVGALSSGAGSITVDTTDSEFEAGGLVLVYESSSLYESVLIDAVGVGALTLANTLVNNYSNATLYPAFGGWITSAGIDRSLPEINVASMEFVLLDNYDLPAPATTQHRGYDVLLDPSIVVDPVPVAISQARLWRDNGIGALRPFASESRTRFVDTQRWLTDTRARRKTLKKWLYARKGKRLPFFYPTWQNDVTLIDDITAVQTFIDVAAVEMSAPFDVLLHVSPSTYLFAQVTAKAVIAGGERLTIGAALGQAVAAADVVRVCLMRLSRHAADEVTLSHRLPNITEAQVALTTI